MEAVGGGWSSVPPAVVKEGENAGGQSCFMITPADDWKAELRGHRHGG